MLDTFSEFASRCGGGVFMCVCVSACVGCDVLNTCVLLPAPPCPPLSPLVFLSCYSLQPPLPFCVTPCTPPLPLPRPPPGSSPSSPKGGKKVGAEAKGIPRICRSDQTPVSLGYPLPVFLKANGKIFQCSKHLCCTTF